MLKTVVVGAATLMIAVGAVAYAQQPPPGGADGSRRPFAAEDRGAFLDARIAALHAGLRLTPEQDKAWPAFEQAYRDLAALRARPGGPGADETLDPVQRIQRRAEALTTRGAALKRYADALAPLYQSLDDGQKRRFGFLSRIGEEHRFHRFAFLRGGDRERGEFGRREGEFRSPSDEFRGPRGEFRGPRGEFGRGFPPPPLHDE
jgi:zinc resistance-associated protein